MATTARLQNPLARLWGSYTAALHARPLRTKVITALILSFAGDSIAQFGIEGRRIRWSGDGDASGADASKRDWDPARAARLVVYGGFVFAPISHTWLGLNNRIQFSSKAATVLTRVAVDAAFFAPTVNFLFPTVQGLMEGKSIEEIRAKLDMVWLRMWKAAVMVFSPTAVINYTFVPLQHRLLVLQSVGLCWQVYLSYINNMANSRMDVAEAGETGLSAAEIERRAAIAA